MRKKGQTELDYILQQLGLNQEIRNYSIYQFLKNTTAKQFFLSINDLQSGKGYRSVEARMVLFTLLKKYTSYDYRMIGFLFDIRYHSKVYHAVKLLKEYLDKNLYKETILCNYFEIEKKLQTFLYK